MRSVPAPARLAPGAAETFTARSGGQGNVSERTTDPVRAVRSTAPATEASPASGDARRYTPCGAEMRSPWPTFAGGGGDGAFGGGAASTTASAGGVVVGGGVVPDGGVVPGGVVPGGFVRGASL